MESCRGDSRIARRFSMPFSFERHRGELRSPVDFDEILRVDEGIDPYGEREICKRVAEGIDPYGLI